MPGQVYWDSLCRAPWKIVQNPDIQNIIAGWEEGQRKADNDMIQTVSNANAAPLMPGFILKGQNEQVQLPVLMHKPHELHELECTLVIADGDPKADIKIETVEPPPELLSAGFQLFLSKGERGNTLIIRHKRDGVATLPVVTLFVATLAIGGTSQVIYSVSLIGMKAQLAQPVCTVGNAVIVPPP
jgi:hypothetical protein